MITRSMTHVRPLLINSLLLLVLAALLITYMTVVGDLPARVYTSAQREYLDYNARRSLAQVAPQWNVVVPVDGIVSTVLPSPESRVRAVLMARYEELDGVSVTVYDLDFEARYQLAHSGPLTTTIELFFPFPTNLETLHDVEFTVDGREPAGVQYSTRGIQWQTVLQPEERREVAISYSADGANSFAYGLQHDQRANVDITVSVRGLAGSQIPRTSLPASASQPTEQGETWVWQYDGLIADRDVHLNLPARLSFSQRLARLQESFRRLAWTAPLLVVMFMVTLGGFLSLSGVRLSFVSYLIAGCGLALFYPLLTFGSGLVGLVPAAAVSVLAVSTLLVAFVVRAAGWRAGWQTGLVVFVFLVLLSLGMLTPWRGLVLSAGGLILVGVLMLLYARRPVHVAPVPAADEPVTPEPTPDESVVLEAPPAVVEECHCPFCGRALADDHAFCPGCGHETADVQRCTTCGTPQAVPARQTTTYCVRCGAAVRAAGAL